MFIKFMLFHKMSHVFFYAIWDFKKTPCHVVAVPWQDHTSYGRTRVSRGARGSLPRLPRATSDPWSTEHWTLSAGACTSWPFGDLPDPPEWKHGNFWSLTIEIWRHTKTFCIKKNIFGKKDAGEIYVCHILNERLIHQAHRATWGLGYSSENGLNRMSRMSPWSFSDSSLRCHEQLSR